MRKRRLGGLLMVVGLLAFACIAPGAVSAHARFKSSDPADNAVLPKAPAQILLTFTLPTSPTKSGGTVTDASGATVSTGFKVDPSDGTRMTIDLKPNLPNGAYTVKWNTVTEDDGGMVDGTLNFSVQAAASTVAPASGGVAVAPAVAAQSNDMISRWLLIAVIAFGVITVFAAGLAFGTRASRS
jgi:copper transport protein